DQQRLAASRTHTDLLLYMCGPVHLAILSEADLVLRAAGKALCLDHSLSMGHALSDWVAAPLAIHVREVAHSEVPHRRAERLRQITCNRFQPLAQLAPTLRLSLFQLSPRGRVEH